MRSGRKALTLAAAVPGLLLGLLFVRESFFGLTAYFVMVPGATVFCDGKPVRGWLHKGGNGQFLILTRTVGAKRESYWIRRPDDGGGSVRSCGDWNAPRFPFVAIGDVNPPCLPFAVPASTEPEPPERAPVFSETSVAFTGDDGGRIQAAW
jgi:hypothetical protein